MGSNVGTTPGGVGTGFGVGGLNTIGMNNVGYGVTGFVVGGLNTMGLNKVGDGATGFFVRTGIISFNGLVVGFFVVGFLVVGFFVIGFFVVGFFVVGLKICRSSRSVFAVDRTKVTFSIISRQRKMVFRRIDMLLSIFR